MSVKVAVRVRPFNNREALLGCTLCVDMQGTTTKLISADQTKKSKDFFFDYSFWSHDQFQTNQEGYNRPLGTKYADQRVVYQTVGKEILDNAWEGYNCCLFAYGQTGSGKSYSMIGYGTNSGIVPISCQNIFQKVANNQDTNKEFEVHISMMEIYNQKVHDLLIPVDERTKQGLKVREHKTQGVYVEGISKHYVSTYEAIKLKMEQGNTHRSVAATQMNACSSRAHTIISIQFRQRQTVQDKKIEKLSVIHLVDLAGSQRIDKTGAEGTRLKQAAGINKSLSVLGLVISTLADKAMGKGKNAVVPYRDSCLTRILQNALGGNSKTLMICAISPASDNYDQTLSTLRYADQAKKIQNKAVINQNQTDRMIRQLTEQNQKLKKMMETFSKVGLDLMDEATLQNFSEAKSQLHFNNQMMKDLTTRTEDKETQSCKVDEFDQKQPHLVNLNQDPMLSRKVRYVLDQKELTIGRKQADPPNQIIIGGVGILTHHATVFQCEGTFYFKPLMDVQDSMCFINGQPATQKTELFDQDRLICGTNSTFLVMIADKPRQNSFGCQIDWEFAQEQLSQYRQKEQTETGLQKERIRHSIVRKQIEFEKVQLERQNDIKLQQLQNQNTMEQEKYKQQLEKLKVEIETQKAKLKHISNQEKTGNNQRGLFEKQLLQYIPKVTEVNQIAKELNRNIRFTAKITLMSEVERDLSPYKQIDKVIKIKVTNKQMGYEYYWSVQKFHSRYYEIRDSWDAFLETEQAPEVNTLNDPFWDPPADVQLCYGYLTMMNLAYMLDHDSSLSLVDQNGGCGNLLVTLTPTDESGNTSLSKQSTHQDEFQCEDLLGEPFWFTIEVKGGRIPDNFSQIFVSYSLRLDGGQKQYFTTQKINPTGCNFTSNYKYTHKVYNMTVQLIEYFKTNNLCFSVFGKPKGKGRTLRAITETNEDTNSQLINKMIKQIARQKKLNVKRDDACSLI